VLRQIGAVSNSLHPIVEEVRGRDIDWNRLESADVVVALPNSISPVHFPHGGGADPSFFDLVIIDEAHHSPAATWRSILDHFVGARAVLLTATPRRADGKALPGSHAFHYPLRLAMADGIYQPIDPLILSISANSTIDDRDRSIAEAVISASTQADHASSAVLIRADTVIRATSLKALYSGLGLEAEVVTSKVATGDRELILSNWREGSLKAVITVDMLGEGLDLPSLRIVGYHDKHKSVPATMQFIGRLARANSSHPQHSILVTARDQDVYPALQGALRALYEEDADWAEILPDLIDEEIQKKKLDLAYLSSFRSPPASIALPAIAPLARAIIFEVPEQSSWVPDFTNGDLPVELEIGSIVGRQTIVYSGLNGTNTQLVLVTMRLDTPKWYLEDELTRPAYDLHVVSYHKSSQVNRRDLIFLNSQDSRVGSTLREVLDPGSELRNGNPAYLQEAFDSLERLSVSSIGVRNTFAGMPGTAAYAMFSGRGVDQGLREGDTNSRALGHAMAQVEASNGDATTAGMAAAKSKYWETRYLSLRDYEAFTVELAGRYWFPRMSASGPLLPNVARAIRTEDFPLGLVLHAEMNPALLGRGWQLPDGRALESLDLSPDPSTPATASAIFLILSDPLEPADTIWAGYQDVQGRFTTTSSVLEFARGAGHSASIAELMTLSPPTVYYLSGYVLYGGVTYMPVATETWLPDLIYTRWAWAGTDIGVESIRAGRSDTIHDRVEHELGSIAAPTGGQRWVLRNDGGGEIADHVVIEMPSHRRPHVELWHSKASSNANPGVRVTDMQVVTQQAAKSRRHVTDRDFWNRIGRRLTGQEAPALVLLAGDRADLLALCGEDASRLDESIASRPPTIDARIVIVQPGLSLDALGRDVQAGTQSAGQVREFLIFLSNAVQGLASIEVIGSD